jgi:hypothetical protein
VFNGLNEGDRRTYQRHDPVSIRRATENLMQGATGRGERDAILALLHNTSDVQFNKVVEGGGEAYVVSLLRELDGSWAGVQKRMLQPQSGHRVRQLAVRYPPEVPQMLPFTS